MTTRETGWAPWVLAVITLVIVAVNPAVAADSWVIYPGGDGPGKGKHVVLVSGDEEYRSYQPTRFGFGVFRRGVKPAEHAMP